MKSPPQEPAKALTGQALLAYYCAARRAGQSPYDESWFAPHFSTWRKGKPRPCDASGKQETVFDELMRLGVLEKVEGPIRRDPDATPLEQLNLPDTTYDGRECPS